MLTSTYPLQQLIHQLFDSVTFVSKLRNFYEEELFSTNISQHFKQAKSIKTDVSTERFEESNSKAYIETEYIVGEIQELLGELYGKSNDGLKMGDQYIQIYQIEHEISKLKQQIQQIKCIFNENIEKMSKTLKQNEQGCQKFVTVEQHRNWEQEILQKLDIAAKRNLHKAESIFADKLNLFQMNLINKLDKNEGRNDKQIQSNVDKNRKQFIETKSKINPESNERKNINQAIKPDKEYPNQKTADIVKTLKSAKSLGNLFGFKK